jgi:carboxylesterase
MPPVLRPYAGPEHQPFEYGADADLTAPGVFLIHGYLGTPAEVRPMANILAEAGWHVRAPLLPGFGPDIQNLDRCNRQVWLGAAGAAWKEFAGLRRPVALFGYSLGAAIAINLAIESAPDCLILVAPFWRTPGVLAQLVPFARRFFPQMRPFKNANFGDPRLRQIFARILPDVNLDDPEVQGIIRTQFTLPLSAMHEALLLGRQTYRLASQVRLPTLIIQGANDPVVRAVDTLKLVNRLGIKPTVVVVPADHDMLLANTQQLTRVAELVLEFIR